MVFIEEMDRHYTFPEFKLLYPYRFYSNGTKMEVIKRQGKKPLIRQLHEAIPLQIKERRKINNNQIFKTPRESKIIKYENGKIKDNSDL